MRRLPKARSIQTALRVCLLGLVVCRPSVVAAQPSVQLPAPPKPPSLGAVFGQVPYDLWHFLNWDTAMILGAGGGAAAVGHIWDDDLAGELETNVRLNDAFGPGKTYGAFTVQTLIGVGMYAGGRIGNKGRLAQAGGDIMRAQILS